MIVEVPEDASEAEQELALNVDLLTTILMNTEQPLRFERDASGDIALPTSTTSFWGITGARADRGNDEWAPSLLLTLGLVCSLIGFDVRRTPRRLVFPPRTAIPGRIHANPGARR